MALALQATILTGCVSAAPRPAHSSYSCMRAAIDSRLPQDATDKRKHCIAAALIAHYCSVTEAYLAALGTELVDLVGPGSAEWEDWHADRAGIACADAAAEDDALERCCSERGY